MRVLPVLLTILLLMLPTTATAQEQLGSVTIRKIPISLDTPGVHPVKFELSGGGLSAPVTAYSDGDTVKFSDLTPGTYHIRELPTRTGDVARATIAPLTVQIPHGDLFDIVVYPKPQPLTLKKTADARKIIPGDRFTYTLEGAVPLPDTNGELHRYVLRDSLPHGMSLTGSSSMQLRTGSRTVPLTEDKHYIVTTEGDRAILARLTPSGLALLAEERNVHDNVLVHFAFGVRASENLKPGSHVINIGHLYPDGYAENGGDSVTSNEHILPVTGPDGLIILPLIPLPAGSAGSSLPGLSSAPGKTPPLIPDAAEPTILAGPPEHPTRGGGLASTGASVLGMVALGALLIFIGITLSKRGRCD